MITSAGGGIPTCGVGPLGFWAAPRGPSSFGRMVQPASDDSMAVDEGVHRWFPAPEHVRTMMCNREAGPEALPAQVHHVHHGVAFAASAPSVHHAQPLAASTPPVHHRKPFATPAPSIHRTHRVDEERMQMDEEAVAATGSGARATAPSSGTGNWFPLVEDFLILKSVSSFSECGGRAERALG